jgi:hypothetical protein
MLGPVCCSQAACRPVTPDGCVITCGIGHVQIHTRQAATASELQRDSLRSVQRTRIHITDPYPCSLMSTLTYCSVKPSARAPPLAQMHMIIHTTVHTSQAKPLHVPRLARRVRRTSSTQFQVQGRTTVCKPIVANKITNSLGKSGTSRGNTVSDTLRVLEDDQPCPSSLPQRAIVGQHKHGQSACGLSLCLFI